MINITGVCHIEIPFHSVQKNQSVKRLSISVCYSVILNEGVSLMTIDLT